MANIVPITGDLFPPEFGPEAIYSDQLRLEPILGDGMEPRLRGGRDFAFVRPVNVYVGEGTYLCADHYGGKFFTCVQSFGRGKLRLFNENKLYGDGYFMSVEDFNTMVCAIVVADCVIRAPEHLN